MADSLYLSLWYPNLRLAALPDKLVAVLETFAAHGGEAKVYAATVWPVSWSESPVFQRVWGRVAAGPAQDAVESAPERGVPPRQAIAETLELLHEDYAYEFQIGWSLWKLETENAGPSTARDAQNASRSAQDGHPKTATGPSTRPPLRSGLAQDDKERVGLDPRWVREPRLVRVTGFGPLFDEGAYEQDGHIRVDFGSDAPFLEEDADLDAVGAKHVEENVRQLVELTNAIEKGSGATARLLWSELGESLAQRLAARLGVGN
jgi:hypothetical protein